jgi:hypothetical protein
MIRLFYLFVMPGLVPGIHVLPKRDVDGRDEPGHDPRESWQF